MSSDPVIYKHRDYRLATEVFVTVEQALLADSTRAGSETMR